MKKIIVLISIFIFSQNIFAQSGWQSIFSNDINVPTKIIKKDSLNYFAFSNTSKYYSKSTDAGASWQYLPEFTLDSIYTINDGSFINENTGFIVGSSNNSILRGLILKTTNGGINWIRQNTTMAIYTCYRLFFITENTGWISLWGGYQPSLIKTTNGGLNWDPIIAPATIDIRSVKFTDINHGWIQSYSGYLCKTTNGGQNWIPDTTFKRLSLYDIYPISENECWVLARDGAPASRYYKTTNGGANWNLIYTDRNLLGEIKFFDSSTGYAYAGSNRVILKTTNGGNNWDSIYINTSPFITAIFPSSKREIIVGEGVYSSTYLTPYLLFLKSSDAGLSWNQTYYNRMYTFKGIHFKDNQNGIAIESGGIIFRTSNGGNNWVKIYENPSYSFSALKVLNDMNILIFRDIGGILKSTDYGDSWTEISTPVPNYRFSKVNFLNELTGYALAGQYIERTFDGGLTWDSIKVPLSGGDFNWTGYSDMSFINTNTGWICAAVYTYHSTNGGGWFSYSNVIKKTTNAGLNWNIIYSSNNENQYTSLKFFDENTGYSWIGHNFLKTTNGGGSWSVLFTDSYFNYFVGPLEMVNVNTGWIGSQDHEGRSISKTTNGGLNWITQFHEEGKFIYSIYAKDENTAWFCGAKNSIYKTTNGGGIIIGVNQISSEMPKQFLLKQNYPNPFNPSTKINYEIKSSGYVSLKVFDLLGKEVAALVNEKQSAGSYAVDFNSSEFNLPSGIYFYTLNAGEFKETKKMVLVK